MLCDHHQQVTQTMGREPGRRGDYHRHPRQASLPVCDHKTLRGKFPDEKSEKQHWRCLTTKQDQHTTPVTAPFITKGGYFFSAIIKERRCLNGRIYSWQVALLQSPLPLPSGLTKVRCPAQINQMYSRINVT